MHPRQRIIRINGFAATIYPIVALEMSFDGDSLSHYYSAVSGSLPALRALARGIRSALVGYSGGVDSALLAVVLRQELGRERVVAAVGRSPSYPAAQWATARAVAERFDVPLIELDTHELDDPSYLANPTDRCFFCKTELWRRLIPEARARRPAGVVGRTNAGDLGREPPGEAARGGAAAGRAGLRVRRARSPWLSSRQPARPRPARRRRVRLFVALNLPPPVREALWAATTPLRDLELPVNWVSGEGIHVTLKFLGEVGDARQLEVAAPRGRAVGGAPDLMQGTLRAGGAVYNVKHSDRLP